MLLICYNCLIAPIIIVIFLVPVHVKVVINESICKRASSALTSGRYLEALLMHQDRLHR